MARLNEPITESIESLTRRFVRQNRELTRANAAQSIKIRALETQVTGLLTENLALRETVNHLQVEVDESREKELVKNVFAIQRQLSAKLLEISGLVLDLESVERKSRRRKSQPESAQRSPRARRSRHKTSLGEAVTPVEGQLPTIVEGKSFPRKTLGPDEITALNVENTSESPEIGPPPTTYFDQEEAESSQHQIPVTQPQPLGFYDGEVPGLLSANFETRRRRRETYVRSDDPPELSTSAIGEGNEKFVDDVSTRPLKIGAKRKFPVQDGPWQSSGDIQNNPPSLDFPTAGERSPKPSPSKMVSKDSLLLSTRDAPKPPTESAPCLSPVRKPLLPKSSNMSPRKVQNGDKPKDNAFKPTTYGVKENSQDQLGPTNDIEVHAVYAVSGEENPAAFVHIKEEPETPALMSLISPSSTQPSETQSGMPTGRPASPRPSNARGNRRSRAQVSYAEPNLISKMRRPNKDLVDAVARDSKHPSGSTASTVSSVKKEEQEDEGAKAHELAAVRTILINKAEPLGKDWKPASASTNQTITRPEPHSPLMDKVEAAKQQASSDRLTSRERRRSTFYPTDRAARQNAPGQKVAEQEIETQGTEQSLERALESLDIYDVKDSSPAPILPSNASTGATNSIRQPHARPPSRTDIHRSSSTGSAAPRTTTTTTTVRPNSRRQTLSSSNNNTNNIATTGLTNPTPTTAAAKTSDPQPPRWNSSKDLKAVISAAAASASADAAKDGIGGGGGGGRGERVANRRRSMML